MVRLTMKMDEPLKDWDGEGMNHPPLNCLRCGRLMEWDGVSWVCPNYVFRSNGHESPKK